MDSTLTATAGEQAVTAPATLGILRELPGWLRRPRLEKPLGVFKVMAWKQLALLIVFEIAVLMFVVLPLVLLWKHAFDLPDPTAFNQIPAKWLLPVAVAIAPFVEEIVFRGWLTGRVRAMWLLGCALMIAGLGFASTLGMPSLAIGFSAIAVLLAAPVGWWLLRKRPAPRWFAKGFSWVFYLVLAAFALMHLSNYPSLSLLMLPLVLPQAWIGLMLGYTRMRIGLPGSMLMHMSSNGAVLAFGMLTGN